jgi:hypothetical protein
MNPDAINAAFETAGAFLIWLNVFALWKHKILRGMHWAPVVLFVVWGYWNIYYYLYLGQIYSWFAGFGVAIANTIWVALYVYLRRDSWLTVR